jgi:uncharacterized protein YceK
MKKIALAALLTAMLGGCASLVNQGQQSISVTTRDADGAAVEHAHCVLSSTRGVWTVDTPGTVTVARGDQNLSVDCTRPGHFDGTVTAISRANGEMFGNVIIGGIPGMAYDYNSGAGLSYPDSVTVIMGKKNTLDARPL